MTQRNWKNAAAIRNAHDRMVEEMQQQVIARFLRAHDRRKGGNNEG